MASTDPHWVYRPILDLIGFAEGTDKGDGYNETLSYGAFTGGDVTLVAMTLSDVDALQTRMLDHPDNKWNSSAAGRYQIVRKTLRELRSRLKLNGSELFNEDMQDRLARVLLYGRGIDDYCEGRQSEDNTLLELAREWASFPTKTGEGYYGGQGGKLAPSRVRAALREVRGRYKWDAPKPAPVAPGGEPAWMAEARKLDGLKEIVGSGHEPAIVRMFSEVGHSWVKDDETAWCAAFVGAMLKRVGIAGTGKLNARSYLDWGTKLDKPVPGCIVVFSRGDPKGWQGHVAFYVGEDATTVHVLGGNQSNAVNVTPYARNRVLGYRWPGATPAAPESVEERPAGPAGVQPRPSEKKPSGVGFGTTIAIVVAVVVFALFVWVTN